MYNSCITSNERTERMMKTVTEIRATIKAKLDCGLISEKESSYMHRRVSQIQARTDLNGNHKKELLQVFA